MKIKITLVFLFLVISCQGPWSYYPENPENYMGIWVNAYIISGRPIENVCFDKMHSLNEVRMQGFAFYESAIVSVSGAFSGKDTTIFLSSMHENPNCFAGFDYLLAEAGKEYRLNALIEWDSSGTIVTSEFNAKATIPQKFKIARAYDFNKNIYNRGDTIIYFPPPLDLKTYNFVPQEYSDEVSGVLVSMIYDDDIYWGENFIIQLANDMFAKGDTTWGYRQHAKFSDRENIYFARNLELLGQTKEIDSIPIPSMIMPAIGNFKLLFYATTSDYVKYRDTYINGSNDSRTQAVYNIEGGAGIFTGMLVDTFEVNIKTTPTLKIYSYDDAKDFFCGTKEEEDEDYEFKTNPKCIEDWDIRIWHEIICEEEIKEGIQCDYSITSPWYYIPVNKLKEILTPKEQVNWCKYRNFPIYEYPYCGSMMVRYSKQENRNSNILEREVKKWCEWNKNDEECNEQNNE